MSNRARGLEGRLFLAALLLLIVPFAASGANDSDVRGTVERVFQQLKARDYSKLYDVLPAATRARISRERFTAALQRSQNVYSLDRMDVGQVRVAGNLAVVDTVLYGRMIVPVETDGKIVVQQYLVREDGQWRVATGDRATIERFLKTNPRFGNRFPIRAPRIYIRQNGKWVAFRG